MSDNSTNTKGGAFHLWDVLLEADPHDLRQGFDTANAEYIAVQDTLDFSAIAEQVPETPIEADEADAALNQGSASSSKIAVIAAILLLVLGAAYFALTR